MLMLINKVAMKGELTLRLTLITDTIMFLLNYRVVEFASLSDMKTAIEKLDDTELNGRRIRLVEDRRRNGGNGSSRGGRGRSRSSSSRSRSRSRRRSRSRSRRSSRSRSKTRSKSRNGSKSPVKSRSQSRSK